MKLMKCKNYFILELNKSSKLDMLLTFLTNNSKHCPNVIIDILNFSVDKNKFIKSVFPFHLNWEKRNKSFILVSDIRENILKDMISINSLKESIDFLHMEELTRNI